MDMACEVLESQNYMTKQLKETILSNGGAGNVIK